MKTGSVLIVYEHRLFAQGLRQMLTGYGLKIREVRAQSPNAQEATRKLQPDLLIAECDGTTGEASRCLEALQDAAPAALLVQLSLRDDPRAGHGGGPLTATCREELIAILETRLAGGDGEGTGR